jgi:hypothetical protein
MQINVDPAGLTQEQREAVAGFILAYPAKVCSGSCGPAIAEIPAFIHKDSADPELVKVGAEHPAVDPEISKLAHDHESTMPEAAFGQPDLVAAAFGAPTPPLPLGATAAPSTAVVGQPSIAPVVPTPTLTAPVSVPAPPAPTPASVEPAPTAPAAQTSHVNGVDLDKHGLPWDGRIHASTKRKNADGSWTSKRGVDSALITQVEAELRQVMGAAPAAPLAPASTGVASSPVVPAAVTEAPQDARQLFVGLVGRASAAIQGQKVTQAEVNQICNEAGIPALPLLANRLDLVATVAARVDALIAERS